MNRQVAAFGILAIWATVVGLHVRREYFKPLAVQLAEGARLLSPDAHFYTIRMNDVAIGIGSTRFDTVGAGFVLEDMTTLDVPALDGVHRAVTRTSVELDRILGLQGFRYSLESSVGRFLVSGRVNGDRLDVELDAGAGVQRSAVADGAALLLDAAVPLRLAAAGQLTPGREVSVSVFDPSTLEPRVSTLTVVQEERLAVVDTAVWMSDRSEWQVGALDTISTWLIEQRFAGTLLRSWVDADGMLVRAESPLGFVIERTAFELAQQAWQRARSDVGAAAGYGVLIESTAIASNADLRNVEQLDEMRIRLLGVDVTGFDLDGGRQRLRGDTLVVRRGSLSVPAGYRLPYRGDDVAAATLAATPLIQADDARIIAAARRAVGPSNDPLEAALRLNEWVYRNVRKEIALSVPSAVQVLEALRGDCNEHTVLYVAMARALGIPTRTAAGLVSIRGRFYYHAWPEVWVGGEWLALDPTLGQAPADASHLRFVIGGLARQVELVRLIGRLQLEVL